LADNREKKYCKKEDLAKKIDEIEIEEDKDDQEEICQIEENEENKEKEKNFEIFNLQVFDV
jgi:hypothetical protein